jgi:hypothetical protein
MRNRIRPNGSHIGDRDQYAATTTNPPTRAEAVRASNSDAAPGGDPESSVAARPAATGRTRARKPSHSQDRLDHRGSGGRRGGDRWHRPGSCRHE